MDYIRAFDVELDRLVYYAGEMLTGNVYLEVEENMRMQNIKIFLRGKAHAEWKIMRAGERRTVKQDEQYIDERMLLWGKDDNDSNQGIPILTRGRHCYPFSFQLPDTALPCSFESKIGTIRYYVRVHLNIPYASCPQCIRYFTIIGPQTDCMDERFLTPVSSVAKRNSCSLCCGKGPLILRATLDRSSFVCGEHIKLKVEVQNGSDSEVWVLCKLIQYVEFFINKGVLGLSKEVRHTVLEAESEKVPPHETSQLDELMDRLVLPIMPPTTVDVCGLVQIYYTLKLYLETSKSKGEAAEINFPITIATVPFRINNGSMPEIHYESAAPNVEGGMYISPEFQLGQVYMGDEVDPETDQTILYHPVYVCVTEECPPTKPDTHLLQVPTRQMAKNRETITGEGQQLQENITPAYNAQQQAVMFQVSDDGKSSSSKVIKPEDKFLKEITAKIASRQMKGQNGEDGTTFGAASDDASAQHTDIDTQVEILREQRKSKDNVHKALVNELRRHLSEGEDGMEIEKVPPSLKKPAALRKASADLDKCIKPSIGKMVMHPSEVNAVGKKNAVLIDNQVETSGPAAVLSLNSGNVLEKTDTGPVDIDEHEEEIEYSEHSALLTTSSDSVQTDLERKIVLSQEKSSNIISMQHSIEKLPPDEADDSLSQSFQISGKLGDRRENSDIHGSSVSVARNMKSVRVVSSPNRRVNNITPAALAATVTCAAPAAADPFLMRTEHSPKVAPKPKQKERHSLPAGHLFLSPSESSELSVETVGRPKSENVDKYRNEQHQDESIA
ncbi:unnamed protein product [Candidula unifasciata]|uniref:Arrestin C-terminal-like domain-containing protein n=1 Tax=Candidula unifasciata TaxID=100452 RepID=A0A8S3ZZP9_9EUPU|nr:unnamed protein product [Candidula unifasciata]